MANLNTNYGHFNGHIGFTPSESVSSFEQVGTKEKRPNVVYIVLDDVGFAQLGCYGSDIETPNIDRLAADGLRYNNFHTTAICSATRASLLTGANHHTVGVSTVVDTLDGSFPNSTGYLDPHYATTAEVLREYGYANFAVGKWHLTPFSETTAAGPYTNWPLQKGFDRYYGFLEGMTDQYNPDLVKDNERIGLPRSAAEGYHLSEDLADQAIKLVGRQHSVYPDKPFFLYLAFGAAHQPHQAPKEYIEKYKGRFDDGWDKVRERWFENQKRLGIIPQEAKLNDRNEFVQPWEELSYKEKAVYARLMEVFAGFLDHTDAQIGRVIDFIKHIGEYENTVFVLLSDNGASAEGGKNGGINGEKFMNLRYERNNVDIGYEHLDEIGSSEFTAPHYPAGWANVGNTPFKWYKTWVHAGGVKDPLIVTYPAKIKDKGGIRSQYTHVTDIAPTVLDIIGAKKPEQIRGVYQQPYHGVSFEYSFDEPQAESKKRRQYFEMVGNRGIYSDGWKAVANHGLSDRDYSKDKWELYHVAEDYSEYYDVADKYPEKLKELIALWYAEAGKYGVFPLTDQDNLWLKELDKPFAVPSDKFYLQPQRIEYTHVITPIDVWSRTRFNQRNHKITVKLEHKNGNEGVLYTTGSRFGGYVLYIKDNRLKYTYNYNQEAYYSAVSSELPEGELTLQASVILIDGGKAEVKLFVNGEEQGSVIIKQFAFLLEALSGVKDGNSTEVGNDYTLPFEYPAELESVVLEAASVLADKEEVLKQFFDAD